MVSNKQAEKNVSEVQYKLLLYSMVQGSNVKVIMKMIKKIRTIITKETSKISIDNLGQNKYFNIFYARANEDGVRGGEGGVRGGGGRGTN